jgi:hypothetical protein
MTLPDICLRRFTIPNQSSVAKAYEQFDEAGRMRPSPYYDRLVDVMAELLISRGASRIISTQGRSGATRGAGGAKVSLIQNSSDKR